MELKMQDKKVVLNGQNEMFENISPVGSNENLSENIKSSDYVLFPIKNQLVWNHYKKLNQNFWVVKEHPLQSVNFKRNEFNNISKYISYYAKGYFKLPFLINICEKSNLQEAKCIFGQELFKQNIHEEWFNKFYVEIIGKENGVVQEEKYDKYEFLKNFSNAAFDLQSLVYFLYHGIFFTNLLIFSQYINVIPNSNELYNDVMKIILDHEILQEFGLTMLKSTNVSHELYAYYLDYFVKIETDFIKKFNFADEKIIDNFMATKKDKFLNFIKVE